MSITKAEIEQERQERIEQCAKLVAELLEEHDCSLIAIPHIDEHGRIAATVQIVSKT